MRTLARPEKTSRPTTPERQRRLSWVATALSAVVAALYAALFVIVRSLETGARAAEVEDTTYGAYLFLMIAYLLSTIAYAVLDRPAVWLGGAALQVVVIALFFLLGTGALDYQLLVDETPVVLWATVITGLEVVLLGVLGYLFSLKPAGRHAA